MASVNKVIIIGNLGRDPEIRYMPNGDAAANMNVATTDKWKNKQGEPQERTEWHRVTMFGKVAEVCGEYLKKGSPVYFEGRLQTRKWQDKDGQDRYTTEIVADRMQMLGSKSDGGDSGRYQGAKTGSQPQAAAPSTQEKLPGGFDDMEDDIPF